MDNSEEIKKIVAKIDIGKISEYLQEHSTSTSLKEIVKYSKRVLDNNEDEQVFKLGVWLGYVLRTICDPNKAGYVKDEKEKKYWLELSEELFKQTIGKKK